MLHITPQNSTIEFQLQIENASIENTSTRLIVNAGEENIISPLSIDNEGNCKGTIPLKEEWNGTSGDIKIEVITEGNYFEPFSKKVIFNSIPVTPKAKIEEIILSPSKPPQEIIPQPIITESKNIKKKKTITKKQNIVIKPKSPAIPKVTEPFSPSKKPKKEPVLEFKKPKVEINNEISKEIKSFFLENKPKTVIKENKTVIKEKVEENITKEAESFFKSK
jgi:hypothetical protein